MSLLFDVFSFKKDGQLVLSEDFFSDLLRTARKAIIEMAKKSIPGIEKKKEVDVVVISFIYDRTTNIKNKIVLWLIDKLVELVPTVTQLVYDFLKEKIENL